MTLILRSVNFAVSQLGGNIVFSAACNKQVSVFYLD